MKERREHSRLDFPHNITFHASADMEEDADKEYPAVQGMAADISPGGLSLVTESDLTEGQLLKVNLPLPGVSVLTPTLGVVRWISRESSGLRAGIKFIL